MSEPLQLHRDGPVARLRMTRPQVHNAFDAGLITVRHDGVVLASATLAADAADQLGLKVPRRVDLQVEHEPYMRWHRDHVFRT